MEANNRNTENTLLTMLRVLEHFDVTYTRLEKEYCLNRGCLNKIRKGKDLPRAHNYYFDTMLKVLDEIRIRSLNQCGNDSHAYIKDVMFKVLLREHKVK